MAGVHEGFMTKLPKIPTGLASHPYRVNHPSDLPVSLRQSAEQALESQEPVDSIFVVPAQVSPKGWLGLRYTPEQALLFTSHGVLHVQDGAAPGQAAQTTYLRAADLLYAHLSLILLYGRLELAGQVNGTLAHIVVEFNTAAESLLQPGLRQLVRQAWGQTTALAAGQGQPETVLRELGWLPMKFSNGLWYHGLQPDERLLGFVFQPSIWTRRWRFLPYQVSATTLLALTDRQLIILTENKVGRQANYGWIFTFCPLAGVVGIEQKPVGPWQELQMHLERGGAAVDRRITLEPQVALAWRDLWTHYDRIGEEPKVSAGDAAF
jgi:hypothetical protein